MGLFGEALLDLHRGNDPQPFFVCDAEGEHRLELGFYLSSRPDSLEESLLAHAAGRCLDIGCGAGRILRWLDARGLDGVGLDIDADALAVCRERGDGPVYESSWEDMRRVGRFDTLLLLNRSIGMAGSIAGVRRLLGECAAAASPGGILIFDSYEVPGATGVLARELRYKYRGQCSAPFPWIHLRCEIMEPLLEEARWAADEVIRENNRYGVVARKAREGP